MGNVQSIYCLIVNDLSQRISKYRERERLTTETSIRHAFIILEINFNEETGMKLRQTDNNEARYVGI